MLLFSELFYISIIGDIFSSYLIFMVQVRLIMRDLSGKFSWDVSMLCAPPEDSLGDHGVLGPSADAAPEDDFPSFEENAASQIPSQSTVQELSVAAAGAHGELALNIILFMHKFE